MAHYDIIIRGGTVVDGTRTPRYVSDIAIKDGKIAKIGGLNGGTADKVLDAKGRIVAPGFVDLHTHYDAQIFWDPYCTMSGWHGVTSVVIGNCGFGFAPCKPEYRERSMQTMERNEAVRVATMGASPLPVSGVSGMSRKRGLPSRPSWRPRLSGFTPMATPRKPVPPTMATATRASSSTSSNCRIWPARRRSSAWSTG